AGEPARARLIETLSSVYEEATKILSRDVLGLPPTPDLIEAVQARLQEARFVHSHGSCEQPPTSQMVVEGLARANISVSEAAAARFAEVLSRVEVVLAEDEPPQQDVIE